MNLKELNKDLKKLVECLSLPEDTGPRIDALEKATERLAQELPEVSMGESMDVSLDSWSPDGLEGEITITLPVAWSGRRETARGEKVVYEIADFDLREIRINIDKALKKMKSEGLITRWLVTDEPEKVFARPESPRTYILRPIGHDKDHYTLEITVPARR